ncbi:MAG: hypothetical protein JSV49_01810, partial [Thermoplasmata archaeon]
MKKIIVILIIVIIALFYFPLNNIQAEIVPPTLLIVDPSENQTVKGVVTIYIVIFDYDLDGISDDLDIDVDNDKRKDTDKDGIEEEWTTSDRDHNNNGIDFENEIDEDEDTFYGIRSPYDTDICSSPNWSFPSNISIMVKIDKGSFDNVNDINRDYINATWTISCEWDTTKFSNGEHTITVRSKYNMNYSKEDSVTVIVENDIPIGSKSNF